MAPPDPIIGLTETWKADPNPKKVNLGVGAYRDKDGKPYVLDCVKQAQTALVAEGQNHEYLPIRGHAGFIDAALELAYGTDLFNATKSRIASAQVLSGTGGIRLLGQFMERFLPAGTKVYMPKPTWGNHKNCFQDAGVPWDEYRYFDAGTNGLDFEGMISDLKQIEAGSVVLLHPCAHNPTGVDPSLEQWKTVLDVIKSRKVLCFFDMAYQGFASGDAVRDAAALRLFVESGENVFLAQSFAKNVGLYGQRVGAFSVICADNDEAARVESQLKTLIRPMYSNPPLQGALLVHKILTDDVLKQLWFKEVKDMAERIKGMRTKLVDAIVAGGSTKDWQHIINQIGMFAFTGLTKDQVAMMKDEFSIYMTGDGRISVAGLNDSNVAYVGAAIHSVTSR